MDTDPVSSFFDPVADRPQEEHFVADRPQSKARDQAAAAVGAKGRTVGGLDDDLADLLAANRAIRIRNAAVEGR